jgi:protein-disulfide isomerase
MSKRRELVERRRQQERKQTLTVLVIIALIAVLLIGGAAVYQLLRGRPEQPSLQASTKPLPANPEPNGRAWGPADAPIKIEEYLDYQCPACGAYANQFEPGVVDAFSKSGKVRYEVRSISFIGQESVDAAQAVLCAADQNKFWEMHNSIFANQQGENQGAFSKARLKEIASVVGLDTAAFNTCLDSDKYASKVAQERDEGDKRGVTQTPTFFVNGKMYVGTHSADDFRRIFAEVAPNVKVD